MTRFWLALFLLPWVAVPTEATQVRIFATRSQTAFLGGTLDGISVDPLGTLRLANRAERLTAIEEPYLFAAATGPDGWIVGTGNSGRVFKVDAQGEVTPLFSTPEGEVFAVWADPDGTVFAGSSPDGKVYRWRQGDEQAHVFFDPQQTYIWALARAAGGGLLVATGTEGKLFKVDREGKGELVYDSTETHVRSLGVLPDGGVLLGTAGEGLVLELGTNGKVRTLYDASQPEVLAFAVGDDGTRYVATLASEASFVDLTRRPQAQSGQAAAQTGAASEATAASGQGEAEVTVAEGGEAPPAGSRMRGYRGPRSEVLRLSPSGRVETVWQFERETVFSMLWQRDRLWVGTGLEGKIYSYQGDTMVLEKDVDERQVVVLLPDQKGPAFATTNAAALYRVTDSRERQGRYTSPVLDAGQMARFGTVHWQGETPRGTSVRFSFRSGVSSEPDQTWSDWTPPTDGQEIPLGELARGRYLQWRAELASRNGDSPRVQAVEISYLRENLKPLIESLSVLDPGQILVPGNFNPSSQAFEPAHPNRDGIFTAVGTGQPEDAASRLKTLWKKGYRTLRWKAKDPNDDELIYALHFRRDQDPEAWLTMVEELEDSHYSFDATVLPDGIYRFRLLASDQRKNLPQDTLVSEKSSDSVVIDHSPPELVSAQRQGDSLSVKVRDALSPMREAVYSANAGEWKAVRMADSLLDGRSETLLLDPPPGTKLLLLRVADAAFNVVTFDLSDQLP